MEILTISKTEAEEVRKQIPESIITITSKRKRSKGKTYFVESIYYGIYKGTHELLPISVFENDPTAISDVKAETNADGVIYNIAGQRMSKLAKGINIVNGKKVIK